MLLTAQKRQELLNIKKSDVSISLLSQKFGTTTSKEHGKFEIIPPYFDTRAPLHLKAGEFINKTDVDTTVGIFLFNKIMVEDFIEELVPNGYYNEVITAKAFKNLLNIVSKGVLEKKIPVVPNLISFLKAYEFYSLKATAIFSVSYTPTILKPNSEIIKERDKLFDKVDKTNLSQMTEVEDKLVADARKINKHDPAMAIYDSGARGSFENDYKNMSIMVGLVANPETRGFDFIKSNYLDGLQKEDLPSAGNVVVSAAYSRAIGTAEGGYLAKQFYAVYQSIVIDKPGTNCGTHEGFHVVLTPNMVDLFRYQNIMLPNGSLVVLDDESAKKYMGKKVLIRSPMFCLSDHICAACAGKRPEMMEMSNLGLTTGKVANTLLEKKLKAWHNSKVKMDEVNPNTLLRF
jgi:hypothetical protein